MPPKAKLPMPEEDELFRKPAGAPRPYNEHEHISPVHAVKRGVAIIYNELGRLAEASQLGGLSAAEAMTLKAYVQTVSEVAKKHKNLHFGMTAEELDTCTDEKLFEMVKENLGTMDPKTYGPEAYAYMHRNKKKRIEYDPEN